MGGDLISNRPLVSLIVNSWDIDEVVSIEPLHSYWESASAVTTVSRSRYVLKRLARSSILDQEPDLLVFLEQCGLPVALPVPTRSGHPSLESGPALYALYPRLDGEVIREHYGPGSLERAGHFGHAIARLHLALQQWPGHMANPEVNLTSQIGKWVIPCLQRHPEEVQLERATEAAQGCLTELEAVTPQLPVQWIHRDLHPANMLFRSDELTGILDFEMVRRGPRVFDPCYCATSILIGGWKEEANQAAWPALFRALLAGYQELLPLSEIERRALLPMLGTIHLIFMAFSLDQGRPEDARCNQEALFWLRAHRASWLKFE